MTSAKEAMFIKQDEVRRLIYEVCNGLAEFLIHKNTEYGNSALAPIRIFSKADPVEQLNVRMDDKLSRILTPGVKTISEDTMKDLAGYWVLREVANMIYREADGGEE
jgi:hypothetical protein